MIIIIVITSWRLRDQWRTSRATVKLACSFCTKGKSLPSHAPTTLAPAVASRLELDNKTFLHDNRLCLESSFPSFAPQTPLHAYLQGRGQGADLGPAHATGPDVLSTPAYPHPCCLCFHGVLRFVERLEQVLLKGLAEQLSQSKEWVRVQG